MSTPSIFNGTWVTLEKDASNMEGYLTNIGLGWAKRKIGKNLSRTITFDCQDGKTMTIRNKTSVADRNHTIVLDTPIDGETEDGRQAKVTIRFDAEKNELTVSEEWDGPTSVQTWTLEDGVLHIRLECKGAKAHLTYSKQ